ncbi:MAG: endolytic transglycosylase MltG [Oscillospiraceae bacterium]|jgi:UPF0755 protein|nr:endolytic transglycosylase MltG [Oscillospiraceae bacterium]
MDDNKEKKSGDVEAEGFYSYELGAKPEKPDGESGDKPRPEGRESDFKVNFDFDSEYGDVPEDNPLRARRERRSGCLGGALFAVFVICVSLVLASLLWLAATDVLGFGSEEKMVQVTVPKDFTIDEIAETLRTGGLIKYEWLFKLYSKLSDKEKIIIPGTYDLNTSLDYRALVYGMSSKSGSRVTIDVTFPEGYTLAQMFNKLEDDGVCTAEELWEASANYDFDYRFLKGLKKGDRHRLEGYLFPDTYKFYIGDTASRVLKKMLDTFNTRFKEEYYERAVELGYTARQVVIIASMIEREAGAKSDRPKIASVIYNRLSNPDTPRLEIDATIHYVIAETGETFSTALDSPYNTYRNDGLPPGPISNPGTDSITAALNPEETGFYYYALSKAADRHHEFFATYEEQRAFVESDEYGG